MASRTGTWIISLLTFLSLPSKAQTPLSLTYEALTNSGFTGGEFVFTNSGKIVVPGAVKIVSNVTLNANGHAVVISGNGVSQIFHVSSNASLTLTGLNMVDGFARGVEAPSTPGIGGAILNLGGNLTIRSCIFSNNIASGATNGIGWNGSGNPGPAEVSGLGAHAAGGAIWQTGGFLSISNTLFLTNRAYASYLSRPPAEGGAVFISDAQAASIDDSIFHQNEARAGGMSFGQVNDPAKGGAIFSANTPLKISGGALSFNQSHGGSGRSYGGALFQSNATLTVSNLLASCNVAHGGQSAWRGDSDGLLGSGGGICSVGDTVIANSAFVGNSAISGFQDRGDTSPGPAEGGSLTHCGNLRVINSTFSANESLGHVEKWIFGSAGWPIFRSLHPSHGGAIYSSGNAEIINCTIAEHTNSLSPLAIATTNSTILVKNSLFATNLYETTAVVIIDGGHNLSSDYLPQFTQSTSSNRVPLHLGPLGTYGSSTPIYPLSAGSPAIDSASDSVAPATDQRGRARPSGTRADIGAFESNSPFFLWGRIEGYIDPSTTISIGTNSYSIDANGNFLLGPIESGLHTSQSTAANAVFRPNPMALAVTVDGPLLGLESFELHSINYDRDATESSPAFLLSGLPGETWNLSASLNLINWSDVGHFTIPNNGLMTVPTTNNPPFLFIRGSYTTQQKP